MLDKHATNLLTVWLFLQVFDDLQKMLSVTREAVDQPEPSAVRTSIFTFSPIMQFTVGVCVALTTIGMGLYAL